MAYIFFPYTYSDILEYFLQKYFFSHISKEKSSKIDNCYKEDNIYLKKTMVLFFFSVVRLQRFFEADALSLDVFYYWEN